MRTNLLGKLMLLDAAVLLLLGLLLIFFPQQIEAAFKFKDLPPGVTYIIGLWGCVFAAMGVGYIVAAANPIRHLVWAQVAIARGALECLLGVVYLMRGVVTFQQAGPGIIVAGLMSLAYLIVYPRKPRVVPGVGGAEPSSTGTRSV